VVLGLGAVPTPHDAADALAVAICHLHASPPRRQSAARSAARSKATSWRSYRPRE
jgi:Holliday junction resolvasome RuvABC endonuclease subunit